MNMLFTLQRSFILKGELRQRSNIRTVGLKDTGKTARWGHTRWLRCWPLCWCPPQCRRPRWTRTHQPHTRQSLSTTGTPGKTATLEIKGSDKEVSCAGQWVQGVTAECSAPIKTEGHMVQGGRGVLLTQRVKGIDRSFVQVKVDVFRHRERFIFPVLSPKADKSLFD